MAHTLAAVEGLEDLGRFLAGRGVEILSTGGTARKLRDSGVEVVDVSDYTGFPEMMDGRVKTLHPMVHGGLLYVRGNAAHEAQLAEHGVKPIDLVVLNLYPFQQTVASGAGFDTCIENIDIGGPSMLRSSAKNHEAVTVVTSPDQYAELLAEMDAHGGATTAALRRRFAAAAFRRSAEYDGMISAWFAAQLEADAGQAAAPAAEAAAPVVARCYEKVSDLKYGCNPHQQPAALYRVPGAAPPFRTLNGRPGYINLLDAVNAWALVRELGAALGLPAAASFKHVSPAGAAVAAPLPAAVAEAYEAGERAPTPAALAYLRARNADPMSSFGDFAALSVPVDVATATLLKTEVCDGIIAPGFEPEALEILRAKKKGAFIVLEADPAAAAPRDEFRELHGVVLRQRRAENDFSPDAFLGSVVTADRALPDAARRDLVLASVTAKYTQSNSVVYAFDGGVIGVGAGQQSRVDCVKLAGRKVATWYLRQHPKVLALRFRAGVKRQARINARVRYIEGDITGAERPSWEALFEAVPEPLTDAEKAGFLGTLAGVAISSDAFFPFRDSIDHASRYGVKYIVQPGGSVADDAVTEACNAYGMVMAHSGVRLFHH